MTKEEIKDELYRMLSDVNNGYPIRANTQKDRYKEAVKMAIKALEQEPILDKVKAEIENDWQLKKYPSSPFSCGLRRAIEIIDKYKAESEEKE